MKTKIQLVQLMAFALILTFAACKKEESTNPPQSNGKNTTTERKMPNMPAYYDATLFTVNMKEMPGNATQALIAHNGSINEIYVSDDLDDPQTFIPVIDAIQGDGFNPLWVQFLIVFTSGHTPHQLFSDTEVDAAVASGEITLTNTGEVYRCAVVGH